MQNYPDGIANDPNAPWNQKDPVFTEYDSTNEKFECEHCSELHFVDGESGLCSTCWEPKEIKKDTRDRMDED